jgi:hypothetical protein
MKPSGFEGAIAELVETADLQTAFASHRLALEWGQMVFTQAVQLWEAIETHEALAYEDKVGAQVRVLDDAQSSLSHLQKVMARAGRMLRRHRRQLR